MHARAHARVALAVWWTLAEYIFYFNSEKRKMITKCVCVWGGGGGGRWWMCGVCVCVCVCVWGGGVGTCHPVPTALGQTETRTNLPNKCNPFAKKRKKKKREKKEIENI